MWKASGHSKRWVRPVRSRDGGVVLLSTSLVEHRQQLRGLLRQSLEVDHGVSPVTVIRVQDEVPVEVAGIQPGQRQPVAISGEGSLRWGHAGPGCRGHEVMERVVSDVTRDPSALIADPDADVMLALGDEDLYFWELLGFSVSLHRGTHRVLEQLEEDMVEVGGWVDQGETHLLALLITNHCLSFYFYIWSTIIIFFTEKGSVLEGLHDDGLEFALGVDHADSVCVSVRVWLEQQGVLVD